MSTTWIIVLSVLGGFVVGGLLIGWLVASSFGAVMDLFLPAIFGGSFKKKKK